ncbi:MAG: sigma-54 dependent transcriptional regulator [Oligoflexia bacterium]|nr:sigma-54 dependent transcriptional regulator [Oligoflexia bacterium]
MSELPLLLICDDDPEILKSLNLSLRSRFEVHAASTIVQAKALAARFQYDIAIIDLHFEGQEHDGVHLIDHMSQKSPGTYLIVLSGDDSVKRIVEAMRRKLFEFVHKEKDGDYFDSLLPALNRAAQLTRARKEKAVFRYLSESPKVRELLEKVERIVRVQSDASILILGETGSGKEFLAQHIALGLKKKLVAANMGSIPRETAESVLFGHERGAFTGAVANKIGLIESADGGIFFLDEIAECSPSVQAKLLRVLQEREVQPLGSNKTRKVNVRFIAATHQDLNQMVEERLFRLDLLQRLNTFVLRLPPLRERLEDILLYANLFLEQAAEKERPYSITADGEAAFLAYTWPGNIRELRNVIERIVVLSNKHVIDAQMVAKAIAMGQRHESATASRVETAETNVRRDEVLKALQETNGNKRQAAL